jgi:hypothetical protein
VSDARPVKNQKLLSGEKIQLPPVNTAADGAFAAPV